MAGIVAHRLVPHKSMNFMPFPTVRLTSFEPPALNKRRKLWELHKSLHCSLIGTCLTAGELRRIVTKVSGASSESLSDHDIHKRGVGLASDQKLGAKWLQKALDERHSGSIRQFEDALTSDDVLSRWREARARGDIPGAYWAAISHPRANEEVVRGVFGDVHMLSHLVGAANRADIQRLAALDAENAELRDKVRRQQGRLRELAERHARETDALHRLLAERVAEREASAPPATVDGGRASLESTIGRLKSRLDRETARGDARADERDRLRAERDELAGGLERARSEARRLAREVAALERHMSKPEAGRAGNAETEAFAGRAVLYVGGRSGHVAQIRAAAEAGDAIFEHHDGGQQEATSLLPGLISRADIVFFPVDCISHDAASFVKRQCKSAGKPYRPLASSGLGAFLGAIAEGPDASSPA